MKTRRKRTFQKPDALSICLLNVQSSEWHFYYARKKSLRRNYLG
ncbi:rpoE leader peptide RseD [Enterobacteriaceae bacterium YMB-R22]|uniref:RpoE leader peptide RseD n=2 Tax=Tenebrionibacter/Tenebrionicola group TaxID=2969848 RepID=A0A8K0V3W7_9ENTR|nr:rpoE leader peptide RseD [Tenebrionibacter intestinalis]MBV4411686.1 rpoE leader peptide RseD [Tenebrionicola larvae]MBV5097293.1 rpoE leader peptide RseD [Tenebrionicola larvae]